MYYFYLVLIVLVFLMGLFFLSRSVLTILSFFSKSPFVPLERFLIEKAVGFLKIERGDRFLDIGSGDGRVVFYCAENYTKAESYKGIEIIPVLVLVSKVRAFFYKKEVFFKRSDARKHDYSSYNKVFMYLLPEFVSELMPKLEKELPSNSIVVSVAFAIPDFYKKFGELKVETIKFGRKEKKIYIWKKK